MDKTFILIDDDPADLDIMKAAIKKASPASHCISFLYAEEALWVLKYDLVKLPDFVIIDLNMPVKSGQECLAELRKTPQFKHVPVILATSKLPPLVEEALRQKGATWVFEKPEPENWPDVIGRILQRDWWRG